MNRPPAGETWWIDLGLAGEPREAIVPGSAADARLAVATVVWVTTRFGGTPCEVTLPRVPWLKGQNYVNAHSLQAVEFAIFQRPAPGQFDAAVLESIRNAVRL